MPPPTTISAAAAPTMVEDHRDAGERSLIGPPVAVSGPPVEVIVVLGTGWGSDVGAGVPSGVGKGVNWAPPPEPVGGRSASTG
jgi:hypothetical protein